jgi:broad specificity phosphatase PhoE
MKGSRLTSLVAVAMVAAAIGLYAAVDRCNALPTTVVLVRHADRDSDLDQLSAAGEARAQRLAQMLSGANLSAIYHTQYRRTQQTAAPVAARLGLMPVAFDAADANGLAAHIREHWSGQNVLVVGHSNTVPAVVRALGGPVIADFDEDDYDNLLVLQLCSCILERTDLTSLQY